MSPVAADTASMQANVHPSLTSTSPSDWLQRAPASAAWRRFNHQASLDRPLHLSATVGNSVLTPTLAHSRVLRGPNIGGPMMSQASRLWQAFPDAPSSRPARRNPPEHSVSELRGVLPRGRPPQTSDLQPSMTPTLSYRRALECCYIGGSRRRARLLDCRTPRLILPARNSPSANLQDVRSGLCMVMLI